MDNGFGRPLDYGAGTGFDYSVWTPGTSVSLTNVTWGSNYDPVVCFDTPEDKDTYFAGGKVLNIEAVTYVRPGESVRLSVPYAHAQHFNYMVVSNPAQPIGSDLPTTYYYFVMDVIHRAPDTTEFVLQLDVWQTYLERVKVYGGYMVQGHWPMVHAAKQAIPRVMNQVMTPEGVDTGAAYTARNGETHNPGISLNFVDFVISSTISLVADPGTKTAPENPTAQGGRVLTVYAPTETYVIDGAALPSYLQKMREYAHIARGIFRVVAMPKINRAFLEALPQRDVNGALYPPAGLYKFKSGSTPEGATGVYPVNDWMNIDDVLQAALDAEHGGDPAYVWMDKFKTYPYSYLSISDGTGAELTIHPQDIRGEHLRLDSAASFLPGAEEVRIIWRNSPNGEVGTNYALSITDLPTLPTVNDNAAIALASQARSIQNARESANWAHQKAMAGNQVGASNATIGMNAAWDSASVGRSADAQSTAIGNNALVAQTGLNAGASLIGGAIAGAPAGPAGVAAGIGAGAGGALAGAMGANIQLGVNNAQLGVRNNANLQNSQIGYGASGAIRDNNLALANFGAQGDYAGAIASINASVQDTMMTPASMSGQVGGAAAAWAMSDNQGARAARQLIGRVHTITRDAIQRIGEQWAMYGYMYNRYVEVGELNLMTHWTYWRLTAVKLTGVPGLNESHLNTLRGIFERGVTVYRRPEDVNRIHPRENRIR